MTLEGSTPLGASWRRVERLDTPPTDDQGPWELVEDKTELVSLDVSTAAHTAETHLGAAPGTEVVLTGLETNTPMLKLGGTVLQGRWDELVGSEILLEQHEESRDDDAGRDSRVVLQPLPSSQGSSTGETGTSGATGESSTAKRRIAFVPVREALEAADTAPLILYLAWRRTVWNLGVGSGDEIGRITPSSSTAVHEADDEEYSGAPEGSAAPPAPPNDGAPPEPKQHTAPCEELHIRGAAERAVSAPASPAPPNKTPSEARIPATQDDPLTPFRPPARADGDAEWGLGEPIAEQVDPAVAAKVERFHALKQQGTHFNATLARNRAFHNPNIYEKLVRWAELDETGSQYPIMAQAAGERASWDPMDAEVLQHGRADHLASLQKQLAEERSAAKEPGSRTRLDFAPPRDEQRRRHHERAHGPRRR